MTGPLVCCWKTNVPGSDGKQISTLYYSYVFKGHKVGNATCLDKDMEISSVSGKTWAKPHGDGGPHFCAEFQIHCGTCSMEKSRRKKKHLGRNVLDVTIDVVTNSSQSLFPRMGLRGVF